MSQNNSTFTSSSYSYSSSSSNMNGTTTGHRAVQQSNTGPDGATTVTRATQNLGQPVVQETQHFDSQGRQTLPGTGSNGQGGVQSRIQDVSDDAQAARDREYLERMEEEYAKREGGA